MGESSSSSCIADDDDDKNKEEENCHNWTEAQHSQTIHHQTEHQQTVCCQICHSQNHCNQTAFTLVLIDLELAAKQDKQAAKLESAKQEAAKPEELTDVVQWQKMSYLFHIKH